MTENDEELDDMDSLFGGPIDETDGDRRDDARVALLSDVTLRIQTDGEGSFQGERVRSSLSGDVSLGGMYVEANESIAEGTKVVAAFELPKLETEIEIPAEVQWTEEPDVDVEHSPWKIGLRFLTLTDEQQQHLETFVSRRNVS